MYDMDIRIREIRDAIDAAQFPVSKLIKSMGPVWKDLNWLASRPSDALYVFVILPFFCKHLRAVCSSREAALSGSLLVSAWSSMLQQYLWHTTQV